MQIISFVLYFYVYSTVFCPTNLFQFQNSCLIVVKWKDLSFSWNPECKQVNDIAQRFKVCNCSGNYVRSNTFCMYLNEQIYWFYFYVYVHARTSLVLATISNQPTFCVVRDYLAFCVFIYISFSSPWRPREKISLIHWFFSPVSADYKL